MIIDDWEPIGIMGNEKQLAIINPPVIKRYFFTLLSLILAVLLLYEGVAIYFVSGERLGFILVGLFLLGLTYLFYFNTGKALILYEDRLVSTDGELLFELKNIASIENGLFSFKPSNGVLFRLKEPMRVKWRLGLWWRFGKRVGIGGCTQKSSINLAVEIIKSNSNVSL